MSTDVKTKKSLYVVKNVLLDEFHFYNKESVQQENITHLYIF